ncbi:MAG: type II toxin-antitoxin system HicB family antitoxin [Chloroflexota bacterium]
MKIKALIYGVPETEGGGLWAEVPALPGCMTQAETYDELIQNIHEAIEGWLSTDVEPKGGPRRRGGDRNLRVKVASGNTAAALRMG